MQRIEGRRDIIADGLLKWEKKLPIVLAQAKLSAKKEVKALVNELERKPIPEWPGKLKIHIFTIYDM